MTSKVTGAWLAAAVVSGLLLSAAPAQADEIMESPTVISAADDLSHESELGSPSAPIGPGVSPGPTESTEPADLAEPVEPADSTESASTVDESVPVDEASVISETPEQLPEEAAPITEDADPVYGSKDEAPVPAEPIEQAKPNSSGPAEEVGPIAPKLRVLSGVEEADTDESFSFWGEGLTEEQETILKQIDKLLPEGSDDWDESQWDAFADTKEGQELDSLWEEFYSLLSDGEDYEGSAEEQAFWESLEKLLPEGSDDWDDAQWEAFYETDDGQELTRLIEEFYGSDFDDDGFEISDEEQAFWDGLEQLIPEGSDDWDETQWEEFYISDEGREFLEYVLTFEFDTIGSEAELEELIAFYKEVFAEDSEWFEDFLTRYFGEETDVEAQEPQTSEPESNLPENTPLTPPVEIKPAGFAGDQQGNDKAEPAKTIIDGKSNAASNELANTGFNGLVAAGVGVLLALLGALFVRLNRKANVR